MLPSKNPKVIMRSPLFTSFVDRTTPSAEHADRVFTNLFTTCEFIQKGVSSYTPVEKLEYNIYLQYFETRVVPMHKERAIKDGCFGIIKDGWMQIKGKRREILAYRTYQILRTAYDQGETLTKFLQSTGMYDKTTDSAPISVLESQFASDVGFSELDHDWLHNVFLRISHAPIAVKNRIKTMWRFDLEMLRIFVRTITGDPNASVKNYLDTFKTSDKKRQSDVELLKSLPLIPVPSLAQLSGLLRKQKDIPQLREVIDKDLMNLFDPIKRKVLNLSPLQCKQLFVYLHMVINNTMPCLREFDIYLRKKYKVTEQHEKKYSDEFKSLANRKRLLENVVELATQQGTSHAHLLDYVMTRVMSLGEFKYYSSFFNAVSILKQKKTFDGFRDHFERYLVCRVSDLTKMEKPEDVSYAELYRRYKTEEHRIKAEIELYEFKTDKKDRTRCVVLHDPPKLSGTTFMDISEEIFNVTHVFSYLRDTLKIDFDEAEITKELEKWANDNFYLPIMKHYINAAKGIHQKYEEMMEEMDEEKRKLSEIEWSYFANDEQTVRIETMNVMQYLVSGMNDKLIHEIQLQTANKDYTFPREGRLVIDIIRRLQYFWTEYEVYDTEYESYFTLDMLFEDSHVGLTVLEAFAKTNESMLLLQQEGLEQGFLASRGKKQEEMMELYNKNTELADIKWILGKNKEFHVLTDQEIWFITLNYNSPAFKGLYIHTIMRELQELELEGYPHPRPRHILTTIKNQLSGYRDFIARDKAGPDALRATQNREQVGKMLQKYTETMLSGKTLNIPNVKLFRPEKLGTSPQLTELYFFLPDTVVKGERETYVERVEDKYFSGWQGNDIIEDIETLDTSQKLLMKREEMQKYVHIFFSKLVKVFQLDPEKYSEDYHLPILNQIMDENSLRISALRAKLGKYVDRKKGTQIFEIISLKTICILYMIDKIVTNGEWEKYTHSRDLKLGSDTSDNPRETKKIMGNRVIILKDKQFGRIVEFDMEKNRYTVARERDDTVREILSPDDFIYVSQVDGKTVTITSGVYKGLKGVASMRKASSNFKVLEADAKDKISAKIDRLLAAKKRFEDKRQVEMETIHRKINMDMRMDPIQKKQVLLWRRALFTAFWEQAKNLKKSMIPSMNKMFRTGYTFIDSRLVKSQIATEQDITKYRKEIHSFIRRNMSSSAVLSAQELQLLRKYHEKNIVHLNFRITSVDNEIVSLRKQIDEPQIAVAIANRKWAKLAHLPLQYVTFDLQTDMTLENILEIVRNARLTSVKFENVYELMYFLWDNILPSAEETFYSHSQSPKVFNIMFGKCKEIIATQKTKKAKDMNELLERTMRAKSVASALVAARAQKVPANMAKRKETRINALQKELSALEYQRKALFVISDPTVQVQNPVVEKIKESPFLQGFIVVIENKYSKVVSFAEKNNVLRKVQRAAEKVQEDFVRIQRESSQKIMDEFLAKQKIFVDEFLKYIDKL